MPLSMLSGMVSQTRPIIGHRLARRHLEGCAQVLAAKGFADGPIRCCFHVEAGFLPAGAQSLLLVTARHFVFFAHNKATGQVSFAPVPRGRIGLRRESGPSAISPKRELTRLTVHIGRRSQWLDVFREDLLHLRRLPEMRSIVKPAARSIPVHSLVSRWRARLPQLPDLPGKLRFLVTPRAAGVAAVLTVGSVMAVQSFNEPVTLRQTYRSYVQAMNGADADAALRFLTPYSRQHLDEGQWRDKLRKRTTTFSEKVDDIRFLDDDHTARVLAVISKPGHSPAKSVQTWKKLHGRWYRAYLEDIPGMRKLPETLRPGHTDDRTRQG